VARWQPMSIISIVKVLGSSTSPVLVRTDTDDQAILKLPYECGHENALVCEYISSRLAQLLNIPIPDFCCIRTDDYFDEIAQELCKIGSAQSYGFLSRYEKARTPNSNSILKIGNILDITKIIFLDTWIRNPDRYDTSPNWNNLLLVDIEENNRKTTILKVIDHERAFRYYSTEINVSSDAIEDKQIFGLFDEFKNVIDNKTAKEVSEMLRDLNRNEIEQIFMELPPAWQVNNNQANRMIEFILRRASFVSKTLPQKLSKISAEFKVKLNFDRGIL
jgi:hypothetical protein